VIPDALASLASTQRNAYHRRRFRILHPFFREVESLGGHWLGRIRNRDFMAWADRPDDWLAAKSLYAKAP
jgi:hypothetical protein